MDGVLDFIILKQIYKDSLKHKLSPGDRIRSFVIDRYWHGTILKRKPLSEDAPNGVWQSYHIKWDDGATDQLSPWKFHPLDADTGDTIRDMSEWDRDKERILGGLDAILKKKVKFEEAKYFLNPVDLNKELVYCTVVPFPTSISTIAERMRNGFYR